MFKLKFSSRFSDIFVSLYLISTLLLRFYIEPQLQGHYLLSLAFGVMALLFLWALIKSEILNPRYFGLLEK